jgi:hypothetical protein
VYLAPQPKKVEKTKKKREDTRVDEGKTNKNEKVDQPNKPIKKKKSGP